MFLPLLIYIAQAIEFAIIDNQLHQFYLSLSSSLVQKRCFIRPKILWFVGVSWKGNMNLWMTLKYYISNVILGRGKKYVSTIYDWFYRYLKCVNSLNIYLVIFYCKIVFFIVYIFVSSFILFVAIFNLLQSYWFFCPYFDFFLSRHIEFCYRH